MAKAARRAKPESELTVRPVIEVGEHTPVYYINHAEVNRSHHEFTLTAARISTKMPKLQLEHARKSKELIVDAAVQLIIPATLMKGLINALQAQLDKHNALKKNRVEK